MRAIGLPLLLAVAAASCVEVTTTSPGPSQPVGSKADSGECASRAGREYRVEHTTLPGNDCGPILGGGAYYTDPSTSCEEITTGKDYEQTIYWNADASEGHGLLVYTDHYEARLAATCSGAYALTLLPW